MGVRVLQDGSWKAERDLGQRSPMRVEGLREEGWGEPVRLQESQGQGHNLMSESQTQQPDAG